MLGNLVNFGTILVAALVGSLLRRGIPKKIVDAMLAAMALCVIYIAIDGLHIGEGVINPLVVIISMGLGVAIGTLINIDGALNRFGELLQRKLSKKDSEGEKSSIAEAFVTTTMIFCIGAMSINGALTAAQGDHTILLAKSVIDMITCLVLSATLGIGCVLSAFSTLAYQGTLTLIFYLIISHVDNTSPMYTAIINHIGCVGSLIILVIGLNMLGVTKLKTADFIPAMLLPLAICPLMNAFGIL